MQKMMHSQRALKLLVQFLLASGLLILLVFLSLVLRPAAVSQAAQYAPTPYVTFTRGPNGIAPGGIAITPAVPITPRPSPRPTSTPTGKKPPACSFPLPQTTTEESVAEVYTFSAPMRVPLDPSWSEFQIYQWLPDNRQVLFGHKDNVDLQDPYRDDPPENIGLLDPRTGESHDLGSRIAAPGSGRPPVWISSLSAVVYPESIYLEPNLSGTPVAQLSSDDYQRRIWLSRGAPTPPELLVNEQVTINLNGPSTFGWQFTIAASPAGSEIIYLDNVGTQLYKQQVIKGALQRVPSPSFDVTQWTYRYPWLPTSWHTAWRPNSTQVFLSNDDASFGASYTFLVDVESGHVCELTLWEDDPRSGYQSKAGQAHWSPNGRYLAVVIIKVDGFARSSDLSDLIVLDAVTGKLYTIDPTLLSVPGSEKPGQQFIGSIAWTPDNRHLAVIKRTEYWQSSLGEEMQVAHRLLLLDFLTGESERISHAELEPHGVSTDALLWSNDGSQLIVQAVYGPYLLSVQRHPQP